MTWEEIYAQRRDEMLKCLRKPLPNEDASAEFFEGFNPWHDIMRGIHGGYSSESDDLAVSALVAIRDGKTFEFVERRGFAAEFMLYVMSGFDLTDYGTSPRGSWPSDAYREIWDRIITRWCEYADVHWDGRDWLDDEVTKAALATPNTEGESA